MASTVPDKITASQRALPETPRPMLKADVRKPDEQWRRAVGRLIEAVRRSRGWTLDEFAGHLGKDPRQVSRWERGEERPQFDVILAVPELHEPLLLGLADLLKQCVVTEWTIRIKRSA